MSDIILFEGQKIKEYQKEDLIQKTNIILNAIHRDLGIRDQMDQYDKIRFIDYISKYYKWLTIEDVKVMFELYVVGKLDCEKHYGKWSANFYVGVINAYVVLQNKARINQRLSLPEPKITEEQIENIHADFKRSVVKAFDRYKDKGQASAAGMSLTTFEFWQSKGFFEGMPEVTGRDRVAAILELNDTMSRKQFKTEISKEDQESLAHLLSYRRALRELYDKWIIEGTDINEIING